MERLPFFLRLLRRRAAAAPYDVRWDHDVEVPAYDGTVLLADHYVPVGDGPWPVLLVRSAYGRGFPFNSLFGSSFAAQGFRVILQSTRGTGGSGGDFHLWRNEATDGQATVDWLRKQDWFPGAFGTIGMSYLSYVQWSLGLDPPPEWRAAIVQVAAHDFYQGFYPDGAGALRLELSLVSGVAFFNQAAGQATYLRALLRLAVHLRRAIRGVPLLDSYRRAFGGRRQEFEDWVRHPYQDDLFWSGSDAGPAADRMTVPVSLVSGWHDLTLEQTLTQYARLRAAGQEPTLMIGPWTHTSAFDRGWSELFPDALEHLRVHLLGEGERTTRVRVHIGDEWRELPVWPPPSTDLRLHLRPGGELGELAGGTTSFDYDPKNPTPSFAGQLQSRTQGARDNKPLEARADVRTFTTGPLPEALEIMGTPTAELYASGSTGHFDLFVRVCDVDPADRSVNVCDGFVRLTPDHADADPVRVVLGAAGHRFAAGHRIRLQVSGGAHPRFVRNYGTGEPLGTAVRMVATRTTVHHDSVRPSAVVLPVV
ncbi:CocE/NonD family hydrolase [Actinoplanes friuliensis]|uniref:Hydrolase n=1 Tax=Actinoplanes friuliensis DSM 7358 TaxID=1246995 RepID=U5W776_9ACTN|nr:CocE/NonD family hydrolase [Actinoplanes friuliensis]AGZ44857.1 hydrolase [Actinoplanes friuliensis DSM 7358]